MIERLRLAASIKWPSLFVAALTVATTCAAPGGTPPSAGPSVGAGHRFDLVRVDARSGRQRGWAGRFPGQNNALAVGVTGGRVFVATTNGVASVSSEGPRGGPSEVIRTNGAPYDLAVRGETVWAAGAGDTAWQVDPRAGRVVATFRLQDTREHSIAADRRYVWVANFRTGIVQRIDPRAGSVSGRVVLPGGIATDIATGFGSVWAIDGLSDQLDRIDPSRLRISRRIDLPGTATAVATGAGSVWVAEDRLGTVLRIDPTTGSVAEGIHVGRDAPAMAVGLGALWVTHRDGTLGRTPLTAGAPRAIRITVSQGPLAAVAVDAPHRALWVSVCPPGLACGLVGVRAGGHGQ